MTTKNSKTYSIFSCTPHSSSTFLLFILLFFLLSSTLNILFSRKITELYLFVKHGVRHDIMVVSTFLLLHVLRQALWQTSIHLLFWMLALERITSCSPGWDHTFLTLSCVHFRLVRFEQFLFTLMVEVIFAHYGMRAPYAYIRGI